jgi:endonuclease YncB( thermonuclease family)
MLKEKPMRRFVPALLLTLALLPAMAWAWCAVEEYDGRGRVAYVYDGDTVRLASGEKIRLVGINSPELDHEHGQHQPQARAARRYLQQLLALADDQVLIDYAPESRDRYQRRLAHLYLPDGRNINEMLVAEGLAFRIAIPPNLQHQACYQQAEDKARKAGKGVWANTRYWILDSHKVGKQHRGFRLVQGRITGIEETRKSIWLLMEGERIRIRIARSDRSQIQLDIDKLVGQRVLARGWLHPNNYGMQLRLKHANDVMLWPKSKTDR